MKFLKLFSIVALSAVSMTMFAAINAQANIAVRGNISGYGDEIDLYQDDASSQLVTDIPATQPSSINMYVVINSTNYSSVKQANLEGLQIVFKANTKETGYTLKFNNVSGEEYFLRQGEDTDPANWIPMTEDYAFTCEKSAEIIFTVVKQAAPAKDYTRDAATVIGNWYTICVPGGVDATEYASVMDVYTVAGYDAAQGLAVDPLVGAMQPGVPYIFQAKAELIEFDYNEAEGALEPQEGANYLTGTFEAMQTANVAYVVANNMLNWAAAGTAVPAYRAYLNVEDITTLEPADAAPGRKFLPAPKGVTTDLEGAIVNGLQNGTYMVNGQLVIVKDGKTFNVLGL